MLFDCNRTSLQLPGTVDVTNELSNWSMSVTVKNLNKTYEEGEFIANLFFQGVYHNNKANLSGSVLVCENRARINNSKCFSVMMGFEDFDWPVSLDEMSKSYVINYTGPSNLGIKSQLRFWEYTVLHDGVQVWSRSSQ